MIHCLCVRRMMTAAHNGDEGKGKTPVHVNLRIKRQTYDLDVMHRYQTLGSPAIGMKMKKLINVQINAISARHC